MITQPPLIAGGTITKAQFIKVSTAADFTALAAGASERVCGVSHNTAHDAPLDGSDTNHALAGDPVSFYGVGEHAQVTLGTGGCTRGDILAADSSGNAIVAPTAAAGKWIAGEALESGLAGEVVNVVIRQIYYPLSA